jgi:hypothetical protein
MKSYRLLVTLGLALIGQFAAAQNTPVRVRGTITGLEGNVLSVKTREGENIKINLPDNVGVSAAKNITMADIKPGDFVGTATMKNAQGALVAMEVHLFPAALRGVVSEGHMNWDLAPGSLMTNATLSSAPVQVSGGREMTLQYKDGSQKVIIPEGIPIFTTVPGDRSLLVPGATIFTGAQMGADGKITTARIQVSKDGARPAQ